jgi:elongation factor G
MLHRNRMRSWVHFYPVRFGVAFAHELGSKLSAFARRIKGVFMVTDTPIFIVEVAIEPKTEADREKMDAALHQMAREDSSFGVVTDGEAGQTILKGASEQQLDAKIDILFHTYHVDANVGAPQVAYRETLSRPMTIKYTHKKQTGGSGEFAEVTIDFKPLPPGSGFVFENDVVGGSIPKEFIPSIEKGLKAQKESGLLAGFPVSDFQATLTDGKYHEVDSNARTFNIAARAAFRELASKDAVTLLEPIMKVEVVTPDDFLGGVIGDLNSRRGMVLGTANAGNDTQVITAMVPLANMFGYINTLQSMCQGRGHYTMRFDRYESVPIPNHDPDPNFPGAMSARAAAPYNVVNLRGRPRTQDI